jgi:putative ribosome biogenesis GTPase RsgA
LSGLENSGKTTLLNILASGEVVQVQRLHKKKHKTRNYFVSDRAYHRP